MNRRGFLQAILASGIAPYVVTTAGVLMPPRNVLKPYVDALDDLEFLAGIDGTCLPTPNVYEGLPDELTFYDKSDWTVWIDGIRLAEKNILVNDHNHVLIDAPQLHNGKPALIRAIYKPAGRDIKTVISFGEGYSCSSILSSSTGVVWSIGVKPKNGQERFNGVRGVGQDTKPV